MRASAVRTAASAIAVALGCATVIIPDPVADGLLAALAGGAALAAFAALADQLLGRWLEHHRDGAGPADFLADEWIGLLQRLALASSVAFAVVGARLYFITIDESAWPWIVAGSGALIGALLSLIRVLGRPSSGYRGPLHELYRASAPGTLRSDLDAAAGFNKAVAGRLLPGMLSIFGTALAAAVLVALAFGGLYILLGGPLPTTRGLRGEIPLLARICLGGLIVVPGFLLSSALLALFRIVHIAESTGRPPAAGPWVQWGRAVETLGLVNSIPWLVVLAIAVTLCFTVATAAVRGLLAGVLPLPSPYLGALSLGLGSLLVWFFVLLPHLYIFVFFTHRDCGWMNAIEASFTLVRLDGRRALVHAHIALLWALSIVRLPGALALLLTPVSNRAPLMMALIRESGVGDALAKVLSDRDASPAGLERPRELLEKGRYLDALNAFQMYLIKNRGDLEALRGVCHSLLALGNTRGAREKLEVWRSMEPANPEPAQLLDELARGLWSEGGARRAEALARCTQPVGAPPVEEKW